MKIAIAQINPTIGDFRENIRTISAYSRRARQQGCSLVIFPELAICGYPPRDLLERKDFIEKCSESERELVSETSGIAVLCGTLTPTASKCGASLYNSAILFRDGRELARVHKRLLPVYDVFDETRYFIPAGSSQPVRFDGVNMGITICEDIWNSNGECANLPAYCENPVRELADQNADLIINISASPYTMGKADIRRCLLSAHSTEYGMPFIYCNAVGGQDSLIFDGASLAVDKTGRTVCRASAFREDMVVLEFEKEDGGSGFMAGPMHPWPECQEEEVAHALELGLRDYTERCGISKVTLGLSGGIDSALTAAVACRALGRENVLGVIMPSPYTSGESIEDAEALANNLGISCVTVPIGEIFSTYLTTLSELFQGLDQDVTEENIQARIRGNILMAISNKLGYMVLTTGNKSELAVGYCTLYGDMSGGYALISDLPKTLVYRVSRWFNRSGEVIPQRVLEKPPSAELRPDQTDQDDLPPYEIIDPILEMYLEQLLPIEEIVKRGFARETVLKITGMVDRNEYKRQQAPPGPKITTKAFGMGRRYPIAHRFRPGA